MYCREETSPFHWDVKFAIPMYNLQKKKKKKSREKERRGGGRELFQAREHVL